MVKELLEGYRNSAWNQHKSISSVSEGKGRGGMMMMMNNKNKSVSSLAENQTG
jgi:hypothetical protein